MPYFLSFLWEKNISYSWSRTWQFYLPQSNWVWDPLQRSLSAFPALGWVECKSIAFGCEKNRATGKCWQILEDRVGILKYTSSNGPPECCPSHPKQVVEVRGRQRGRSNYNTLHQVLPGASIIIVGMVAVMVKRLSHLVNWFIWRSLKLFQRVLQAEMQKLKEVKSAPVFFLHLKG